MQFASVFSLIKRFWLLIILSLVTAITVAACNPLNYKTAAAQVPQLVQSILSDPKTFNYPLSQESPNIFGLTYEGLTTQNPITGKIEPNLAESWQISDDKLKIVFTLRENLKWSDGQPLTVDDVIFSYNDIYLNEAIPTDVRDTLRIGEKGKFPTVKKIDDRRVEFTTPEPFAPFLSSATANAILPAHALEKSVKTKDSEGKPLFLTKWGVDTPPDQLIVNGPYKLERYDTSQRLIFRRNPYYWRKDAQGNPQPYIERIVWQIVESTDTSLLQFRSGGLDNVGVTPEYFSLLKVQEKQGNFKIYNGGSSPSTTFIFFNLNKGKRDGKPLVDPIKSRWFNTVEFRQAVAYAIDRQTMINNTYRGLGKLQDSPLAVQCPYYISPKDGLKAYDHNPEKAKQLLIKAGFKYNEQDQLIDTQGNRVRFTLLTNAGNKIREAIGTQIKQDLSKIGIQVDFTPLAWNTYTDKITNTLDFDAGLIGFGAGLEPNDSANLWSPQGGSHLFNQKPQAGQKPVEGWEASPWEAKIGELYIKAARELDDAKRKEIYVQTQQLSQEYLPLIHLVNAYSLSAVRDRFEGINFSALGGAFWNIHEIKVTK
ncbi:ABC transporter substrate-binding protein [Calothrix sp. PCC 7507]|uniref:ABC transporter substrate-binding protein n=1 Tax=Calothrix sp. PCC 7507 TaxID=99598 RepID=UPI00029F1643|nr:ABC transporter substrate-binding protein [Calothrix sp. PCC 7507]AFY31307.1 ABC-type transporter, periplasmic subunit [Calothrix sp. PCC 7507]